MMATKETPDIRKFSLGRIAALGATSMLLCMSFFLSILTPFPLTMSSVLYGRARTIVITILSTFVFGLVLAQFFQDSSLLGLYIISGILAFIMGEIIHRDINPVKGIVITGSVILALLGGTYFYVDSSSEKGVKLLLVEEFERIKPMLEEQRNQLKAAGETDTFEYEAILSDPQLLAEEVLRNAPSFIAVSIFALLWINMFFALKTTRVLRAKRSTSVYSDRNLLEFKMPDQAIWGVIVGLALYLGTDFFGVFYSDLGLNILKVLGVFYFFHGFGLYLYFLDKMRIFGFFRTFLVITTIFMVSWGVAVIGVADTFIDFKKFLNKKNQGE